MSGRVTSYGNCTYLNGKPLCTGLLAPVPGCTVTVMNALSYASSTHYTAITDNSGDYSFDNIAVIVIDDTFHVSASAGPGYSVGRQNVVLSASQTQTVNFNLEVSFSNRAVVTNDSLSFIVSTDRKIYDVGDSIRIRYSFQNTSTHAIQYYLNIGCQYDLLLTGSSNDTLYWLGRNRRCPTIEVLYSIDPDSSRATQFSAIAVTDSMDSAITVSAKMESISITESAVSIPITVRKSVTGVWRQIASPRGLLSPRIGWADNRGIVLFLPRSQRVSMSLYTTAGRLIRRILDRQTLPAGRSIIAAQSLVEAPSVYIAVLKAEGFSIAEAIRGVK